MALQPNAEQGLLWRPAIQNPCPSKHEAGLVHSFAVFVPMEEPRKTGYSISGQRFNPGTFSIRSRIADHSAGTFGHLHEITHDTANNSEQTIAEA
jgi:hypothetical protein